MLRCGFFIEAHRIQKVGFESTELRPRRMTPPLSGLPRLRRHYAGWRWREWVVIREGVAYEANLRETRASRRKEFEVGLVGHDPDR